MRKWLKASLIGLLSLVMLTGCVLPGGAGNSGSNSSVDSQVEDGYYTVKFELCTTLKTNKVTSQEVEEGDVVVKPSVGVIGDNPDRMEIDGWYTDAEYTNEWNFTMDVVEEDMTLYAKWVKKFAVTYYLGDEVDVPMYTRYVKEGDLIPYQPELADGYESDGFFTTAMHMHEFDFTQPITEDVNIYIHRSENIYFSGRMIAERFEMQQAYAKGGTIEYAEDENGEGYAKMNFGYSTSADPHVLLQNVTLDISGSQKLEVTFKNLGAATSLKFYYVNWMADGSLTDGPSFNENNTFTYRYKDNERNMSPDDEWVTKVFDFASILNNGVSNWGISATMIRLRIQSCYVSENEEDRSNELWIKSIKGIADDTYVSTDDSEDITALRVHDDPNAVQDAANAQEDVLGWVFPKDYNLASENGSQIYEKTNGVLFYSEFRAQNTGISFRLGEDADGNKEEINLNEKTLIRIRLTNFGYASKLKLEYRNSEGFVNTKDLTIAPFSGTPESKVYTLNMFGEDNYEGLLSSLSFKYDSVGVNNAILFESIEFFDFQLIDIPGINMNDKNAGVEDKAQFWTNASGVTYTHNGGSLLDGATVFTAENGAYVERETNITNRGYKTMTLKYKDVTGISKVNVGLTINGAETVYTYDVSKAPIDATAEPVAGDVRKSGIWSEIFLPFAVDGKIEKVKVSFEGAGTIAIQELRFMMDQNSGIDLSDPAYVNYIEAGGWDRDVLSYDNSYSAASLTAWYKTWVDEDNIPKSDSGTAKYYFGPMLENNQVGEGNIDLTNKSKLIVIYNNTGDISALTVALSLVSTSIETWKTEITEPYAATSGKDQHLTLETGMAAGEWASVEIDLSKYHMLTESTAGQALAAILFQQTNSQSTEGLYIRAFMVV